MCKIIIIFSYCFVICLSAASQIVQWDDGAIPLIKVGKVEYVYDFAGNRTTRTIVPISKIKEKEPEKLVFEQEFGPREIKVYPNPTKGDLYIDVLGGDSEEVYRTLLYDMTGKQLLSHERKGNGSIPVNMGALPSGFYILIINTIDGKLEYKIVKE